MLIYLIAALQALAYAASVPVCAAVCLTTRGGLRLGVGLSAFERRFALRRARRFDALPPEKEASPGGGGRAWELLRYLRKPGVSLRGRLGLGDAAATAMACGALRALASSLAPRARRCVIDIRPDFSAPGVEIELQGMIRARAGQVITALARSGIDHINRRIARWTDIRSRES